MSARIRIAAALALAVAAGCGAAAPAPGPARAHVTPGDRELVLYRDGALVRQRHTVSLLEGRGHLTIPLPGDVAAGAIHARVVSGDAELGTITVVEPTLLPGDPVEVRDGETVIRGVLRWTDARQAIVDTDEGVRLLLDPRHVVRREPGGAARRIDVELLGAGDAVVELAYVTERLRWRADYTLVMDPDTGRAQLHGALGIDDTAGIPFDAATITLVDTARPVKLVAFDAGGATGAVAAEGGRPAPPKVEDPTKPRGEQPAPAAAKPAETPRTTLPFTVRVEPGVQSVSLIAGSLELPARQTLVYDPVGDDLNLSGKIPHAARDYGMDRRSTAVSQSIDVDLASAKVPAGLPAGTVRLVERTPSGALAPLGESKIFERASTGSDALAPTTTIAVGRAAELEGKRTRREYTFEPDAKRLVEDFAIELTNTSDRPREVIVREHFYRGLNWKLAYHSAPAIKEGPQKIAMTVTVPANGTATVVYRIVYHW